MPATPVAKPPALARAKLLRLLRLHLAVYAQHHVALSMKPDAEEGKKMRVNQHFKTDGQSVAAIHQAQQVSGSMNDRRAGAAGILISPPRTTGDGYYEAVIADPDGNLIEIVA